MSLMGDLDESSLDEVLRSLDLPNLPLEDENFSQLPLPLVPNDQTQAQVGDVDLDEGSARGGSPDFIDLDKTSLNRHGDSSGDHQNVLDSLHLELDNLVQNQVAEPDPVDEAKNTETTLENRNVDVEDPNSKPGDSELEFDHLERDPMPVITELGDGESTGSGPTEAGDEVGPKESGSNKLENETEVNESGSKPEAEKSESSATGDKTKTKETGTGAKEPTIHSSLKCNDQLPDEDVINLDDDDDDIEIIEEKTGSAEQTGKISEEESEADGDQDQPTFPMIRLNSNIFEQEDENENSEEEQDQEMQLDPDQLSNMMEVEYEDQDMDVDGLGSGERRPKRAAAQIAANTIKVISSMEKEGNQNEMSNLRLDPTYRRKISEQTVQHQHSAGTGTTAATDQNRCHQCQKIGPSQVVIRQYGADIHLCSNQCFVAFRNPDPRTRPLPCAKCGELSRELENTKNYYWETMNFCSDVCVCEFQLQIGGKCSTCARKTPWTCMGKYCVRFGSDIRQFCTAACLETYKKSARVCFHCQLDIKRLGNVVLANIPTKASPKEFCSQDCVEMYLDANSIQIPVRPRASTKVSSCKICRKKSTTHKELLTPQLNSTVCSEKCWERLLTSQCIRTPTKCETCTKFINMDTVSLSPSFYVATEKKTYGFCSATCKNVYVLKSRQILSCISCKVKKYNYDLIEYNHPRSSVKIAVCSLHCLPSPSPQVITMREQHKVGNVVFRPIATKVPSVQHQHFGTGYGNLNQEQEVINLEESSPIQISSVTSLLDGSGYTVVDNSNNYLTVRQMNPDDILEIVDEDGKTEIRVRQAGDGEEGGYGSGSELGEEWTDIDVVTIIEPPEPPEQRNKACQVWPRKTDKYCQTDVTEEFPAIEPPRPFPIFIPYPVYIPCPTWVDKQPCPVAIAMPIPIPIPIPVDRAMWLRALEGISNAMETVNMDSPATASPGGAGLSPMVCDLPPPGTGDEEMMDTSSSGGKSEDNENEQVNDTTGVEDPLQEN